MEDQIEAKIIVERVKVQLTEFYSGKNWVADNFWDRVLSLDEDKTLLKMPGHSHSVAQLVGHIAAWRNFGVQKLTGNDTYDIEDNSKEDWSDGQNWKTIGSKFELCHQNLLKAIENFPTQNWNKKVPGEIIHFFILSAE